MIPYDRGAALRTSAILTVFTLAVAGLVVLAAPIVPTDAQMPGTQPLEVGAHLSPDGCKGCHAGTANPELEPWTGWQGSMMAHSSRDPLFWAALAVAEQDFLPDADPSQRGGAGDYCLRCHLPNGWLQGRSTPTDGSGFNNSTDANGVECMHCHRLVDPDPPVNVPGTVEVQNAPFVANDGVDAYRGSGMYVINSSTTRRLGPYDDPAVPGGHPWADSALHRKSELCGTCHDVSNPIVGDLAHNFGAQQPLTAGTYSGVPGSPVAGKAAFNNPPQAYGVVERTYSEWKYSAFSTLRVDDFASLPADLQHSTGSLAVARDRAYRTADGTADYVDGETRYFTCQTCHMSASTGKGCVQGGAPTRSDLPRHDLTGAGHWVPDAIAYQDAKGTLRFGTGLAADQLAAMDAGQLRAAEMLQSAGNVSATQSGGSLDVRVTNLTGHKLITGYPEGRRMWLNVKWYDEPNALGNLILEQGAYGPLGNTVQDLDGNDCFPQSLLDPAGTTIFDTEPGVDQQWANQLIGFGLSPSMPLAYDRITGAVTDTLGSVAAEPPGSMVGTFHFALNNVQLHDTRIPPYGFGYDDALAQSMLPVPAAQFGNPGPGGTYDHFGETSYPIPTGAKSATVTLYFQQTSWEYVQFLWLQNDTLNPFLGQEGVNLLDAWCNTFMAPPVPMDQAATNVSVPPSFPGEAASPQDLAVEFDPGQGGVIDFTFTPACSATGHTLYRGPLSLVSSYAYSSADCNVGFGGTASAPAGSGDEFFLIVGNDGSVEGSYGRDNLGVERPEDTGTAVCDLPQALGASCDP